MKLLRNAKTLIFNPAIARDYLSYQVSRWHHAGQAVQYFPGNVQITGWSGFSEFHAYRQFMPALEQQFLMHLPLLGEGIIDVGANLGIISILLAKRFPYQSVYAFEANPAILEDLKHNIALNTCSNIQVQPYVVTSYNGQASFTADPIHRSTNRIATTGTHLVNVPCLTLDSFAQNSTIHEIALLKVDVEGYEESVFWGARELLKQHKIHVIYYEFCPYNAEQANLLPESSTQLLQGWGYGIYYLNDQGLLSPIHDLDLSSVSLKNLIALSPIYLNWLTQNDHPLLEFTP